MFRYLNGRISALWRVLAEASVHDPEPVRPMTFSGEREHIRPPVSRAHGTRELQRGHIMVPAPVAKKRKPAVIRRDHDHIRHIRRTKSALKRHIP